jgi:DNA-binding MarR family transcriptional regulator
MHRVEEVLVRELLKEFDLDLATEDNEILTEALRSVVSDEIDAESVIKKIKEEYFANLRKAFREKVSELRAERAHGVTEKQLWYLAALVFAESLLDKPVSASLVFEILRCIGMEESKNYPNRYYFLKQLEEKGLVKSITVMNSKSELLYCSTEEGKRIVDGSEAFNTIIKLREQILNDPNVRRLIDKYSKDELEVNIEIPKILETSQIISESDSAIKILLYGREMVNLTADEILQIDSLARDFGKFTQTELRKAYNSEKKAMAYIVYAYEKGWIRIAEKGSRDSIIFERVVDHELEESNFESFKAKTT